MKKYKGTLILTTILILLPILVGLLLWERLPEEIATHFGMDGTPNGWSSKAFTVFGIPFFLLGCQWICFFATIKDPKYQNIGNKVFSLVLWIIPATSFCLMISCYGYALGYETSDISIGLALLGILFIIIGNYLPKCRQNYTVGIKIPWTLHDEENWNHTHRFAGFLWVICGFIMLGNIFLRWDWLIFAVLIVMAAAPIIYSFVYYVRYGEKKVS